MFNLRSVLWTGALSLAFLIASESQAQQDGNSANQPRPLMTTGPMPAQFAVLVPTSSAVVLFNNVQNAATDGLCRFDTPGLLPGSWATYAIKAIWMDQGQIRGAQRTVKVARGSQVIVDFTQSPPAVTFVR
jgi:uncharacterized protein (TIGR03000 family)